MSENDTVVIITGAAGALGRAVVQRFLADGARLALFDRDAAVLKQMFPAAAFAEAVDITDEAAVSAAVGRIVQSLGRIDALVHVAGGFEMGEGVAQIFAPQRVKQAHQEGKEERALGQLTGDGH